jgi:predicted Ser/Thr protein kinase
MMFRVSDVSCGSLSEEKEACEAFGCVPCGDGDCISVGERCKKNKKSEAAIAVGVSVGAVGFFALSLLTALSVFLFSRNRRMLHRQRQFLETSSSGMELRSLVGSEFMDHSETFSSETSRLYEVDKLQDVRVSHNVLSFGYGNSLAPIDTVISEEFTVKNVSSYTVSCKCYPPNDPRFALTFSPDTFSVKPDAEVRIEAKCIVTCTTAIDTTATIGFCNDKTWKESECHAKVSIRVESVPSIKLDPTEIKLGDKIGDGGFGTVYRGTWRGQDVAVKVIKNQECDDTYDDFLKETGMLDSLRNQFIVNFVGACFFKKRMCILTEFMELGSLRPCVEKHLLSDIAKVKCLMNCGNGLKFLHASGIIHRDIKPDNLLVVTADENAIVNCKLTDFGTTRGINKQDATQYYTKGVGTPVYMAPEILGNEKYSTKVDVYSFALVAWFLVAEKEPYLDFKSPWDIAAFVTSGKRLDTPATPLGVRLKAVIESCWIQSPQDRPEFVDISVRLDAVLSEMK